MTGIAHDSYATLPARPAPWLERCCLEIGHRCASVALLVLCGGWVIQQIGKDASLLLPIAFGFANFALASAIGAFAIASHRRARRLEAIGILIFCVVMLVPLVVMMVRIRTGEA